MKVPLAAAAAVHADRQRPVLRRLIAVFALTQTIGYGSLIQSFTVLLLPMAEELEASRTAVTLAATLSTVVGAVAAVPVGTLLDRYGGRALMTAGSGIGVVGVLLWSTATDLTHLYLAFVLIGLALAMSTYEAAFAVLVVVADSEHRDRSIIVVSMVTGFATSLYYPLTGWLDGHLGWRHTLLVLAASLAVVVVPAHLWAVPGRLSHARQVAARGGVPVRGALRSPRFWLLLVSFVAQAGATSAFLLLMVTWFRDVGHSAGAAAALPVAVGVLQLLSRLALAPLAARFGMTRVTAVCFGIQGVGLSALPLVGASIPLTVACVAAFGLGYGVSVVARPSIVADSFGVARFAGIFAVMAIPMAAARAGAPLLGAGIGSGTFLYVLGAVALLSAVALLPLLRPRTDPHLPKDMP